MVLFFIEDGVAHPGIHACCSAFGLRFGLLWPLKLSYDSLRSSWRPSGSQKKRRSVRAAPTDGGVPMVNPEKQCWFPVNQPPSITH